MRPYDDKGRFVPLACPETNCGAGTLQHEEGGLWTCDGLMDPEHVREYQNACCQFPEADVRVSR